VRDHRFEQQRYRASELSLVAVAIVLWNAVYLERATQAQRAGNRMADGGLLQYLLLRGWKHINLTGDYV